MVKLLNDDYMYNAGDAGYSYTANTELWSKFVDLDYQMPTLRQLGPAYLKDGLILLVWLLAALGFAYWSVQRAVVGEESA